MRYQTLQLLRFIAASLVLLFHLQLFASGYKGVDLFFVISGFVMQYSLCRNTRPTARQFIINRFTKIFFLYWLVLFAWYVLVQDSAGIPPLQTILLIPGHHSVLGLTWSLSYELYFYCCTAIVIYLAPVWSQKDILGTALVISAIITILSMTRYTFKGSLFNFLLGPNTWQFLMGFAAGFLIQRISLDKVRSKALGVCVGTMLLLIMIGFPFRTAGSQLVYGTLSFLAVCGAVLFERNAPVNHHIAAVLNRLGEASYAVYLLSSLMIAILHPTEIITKWMVFCLTILAGILLNHLIEQRGLALIRGWFKERVDKG